jgi:DNA-binding transcriptional regulator YiaG
MNTTERSFSELVVLIRRQLALSQEDLARQLGVSYTTVNRWERGHNRPSRLARARMKAFCEENIQRGELELQGGQPS